MTATVLSIACALLATTGAAGPSNNVFINQGTALSFAGDWLPGIGDISGIRAKYAIVPAGNTQVDLWTNTVTPARDLLLVNYQDANLAWHTYLYSGATGSFALLGDWLPGVDLGSSFQVGDFNGDGAFDLLVPREDATGAWHNDVYLNTGGQFSYAGDWLPGVGRGARYAAFSSGILRIATDNAEGGVATSVTQPYSHILINMMDASGRWHNYVYSASRSGALFNPSPSFFLDGDWLPDVDLGSKYSFGDFNGDGAPDLLVARVDTAGAWHYDVYLSGASGFSYLGNALPGIGSGGRYAALRTGPIQLSYVGSETGGEWVVLSPADALVINTQDTTGTWHNNVYSFSTTPWAGFSYQSAGDWLPNVTGSEYFAGDFNGDGRSDLLIYNPPAKTGTIVPKYQVLALIYAPPGSAAGSSFQSYIKYLAGTSYGTNVTNKNSLTVSSTYSVSPFQSTELSFGSAFGNSSSSSTDVLSTLSGERTWPSDNQDGLDHMADQIVILRNPKIDVTVSYPFASASLSFGVANGPNCQLSSCPDIVNIPVGCILDRGWSAACPTYMAQLDQIGVPSSDYSQLLKMNPFMDPAAGPAIYGIPRSQWPAAMQARFVPLSVVSPFNLSTGTTMESSFFYAPVNCPWQTIPSSTVTTWRNQITSAKVSTATTEITVAATMPNVLVPFVKSSTKITYTHSTTNQVTTGTNNALTLYVGQPSCNYSASAPSRLHVYVDTIFNTYMFNLENVP